jgi:hypothetical protein
VAILPLDVLDEIDPSRSQAAVFQVVTRGEISLVRPSHLAKAALDGVSDLESAGMS